MDANARSDAEATVDKAFVAELKAYAKVSPRGCGNHTPVELRRSDGQLRVRTGHRSTIGCIRAGVPVFGFVAGDEGDERADLVSRLQSAGTDSGPGEAG